MSDSYIGVNQAQQSRIQPMFEVHAIPEDKEFVRTQIEYEEVAKGSNGRPIHKRVAKKVKESGGYMVFFPRGHSIRVRNTDELRAMGFHMQAGFVDMESGEVAPVQQVSLRSLSERRTALPSTVRQDDQLEAVLNDDDDE